MTTANFQCAALMSLFLLALQACSSGSTEDSSALPVPPETNNRAPVLSGTPAASVVQDRNYSFVPDASDPDGDSLTFTVDNRPAWAIFDSDTGEISGTPSTQHVGNYADISITVSDGKGEASLGPFAIEVVQASVNNQTPVISGTPDSSVVQDRVYSFVPGASDPDGDQLTFSIKNLPSWANFDSDTGELSGMPGVQHLGSHTGISISVSDGQAEAVLGPFAIEVVATTSGSLTLSWNAPTQNADGSALTDLAGYRVRWGTQPGNHPNLEQIGNPALTTLVIDGLTPGTYFFVVSAFDTSNNESAASNEASGTVL